MSPRMSLVSVLLLLVLLPLTQARGFGGSEAEQLAGGEAGERDYHITVGAGTGGLYGGLYGVGTELGYGQVSLVVSGGYDIPSLNYAIGNGSSALSEMSLGEIQSFVWRAGMKVYLAGDEMMFRPHLAALVGPLLAYEIDWYGKRMSGTYLSFGGAAGCDYDPGARSGVIFTMGLSAFLLTHSVPEEAVEPIRFKLDKDLPFIHVRAVAGMNYRF